MTMGSFDLWIQSLPIGIILLAIFWSSVWKAIALWRAGSKKHLAWFIVLFIVNTLGILEILYIFVFSKCCGKKQENKTKKLKKKK